jgi:hypothetical protein
MIEYAVITSVPTRQPDSAELPAGNMQPLWEAYQLATQPGETNNWQGTVKPLNTLVLASLGLMFPVFELGEVLIIDFQTRREVAPPHRSLDAYEITYERFESAREALDRSAEITDSNRYISKEN